MSPSRIQSAAGTTTPPFRSPAFPTVSGFPFSPRSALLRPGPCRPATKNEQLRELAARAKVPLRTALPFPPLLLPLPERVYTPRNPLAISL